MNHQPRRPLRRLLAVAVSAAFGLLGAVAVAGPASAQSVSVSGSCAWDAAASEWVVTWTIESQPPADADSYRLTTMDVTPDGSDVDGIATAADGAFPHAAAESLVGEQRLPADAASASLTIRAEWDTGEKDDRDRHGAVQIPADCQRDGPGQLDAIGQQTVDCEALAVAVTNPSARDLVLTFVPSVGGASDVEVPGGVSMTVEFPPSEGLTVDVLVDGAPVALEEPIAITPEEWAALDCDAAGEADGGEGGDLPATGTTVTIVAAGALALLALGAGLYLVARRRRITFTA